MHLMLVRTYAGVIPKPVSHAGKWTVQQAAEMSVAAPTIEASLDGRFVSGLKDERVKAAKFYEKLGVKGPSEMVGLLRNYICTLPKTDCCWALS